MNRGVAFAETTPKFRGNAALGWNDDHWVLDAYLHYTSRFDTYAPAASGSSVLVPTPGYLTLAGRVGYRISPGLVVAVSGQNLGSPRQIQGTAAGLQAPRRVILSLSKSC